VGPGGPMIGPLGSSACAGEGAGHHSVPPPGFGVGPLAPGDPAGEFSLPPFFYEADPTDAMDVALLQELVALNLEVSARLNIKRSRPGEYEIEGVRVSLYWQTAELYVRARRPGRKRGRRRSKRRASSVQGTDGEEEGSGKEGGEAPLAVYLRELANVDSRKVAIMDPKIDSAVAAAAFAGATAAGVGPGSQHTHGAPPLAAPWPGPGGPGPGSPPVGPYGAAIAAAAAAAMSTPGPGAAASGASPGPRPA